MDHGLAGDDITYHHCNRSGSSWPPGEGGGYEYASMGCCKCKGLGGEEEYYDQTLALMGRSTWEKYIITKPGPNGTRVEESD